MNNSSALAFGDQFNGHPNGNNFTMIQLPFNDPSQSRSFIIDNQEIEQAFHLSEFKSKYIFEPFQYEDRLEQTLLNDVKGLNPKINSAQSDKDNFYKIKDQHPFNRNQHELMEISPNNRNSSNNVHFLPRNNHNLNNFNTDSFNSTSKSIKTNKTIFGPESISPRHKPTVIISESKKVANHSQVNEILNKSTLGRPPNLLMKKTTSVMSNAKSQFIPESDQYRENSNIGNMVLSDQKEIEFNARSMKKKTLFSKEKYDEQQKMNKKFNSGNNNKSVNRTVQKNKNNNSRPQLDLMNNSSTPQGSQSLCQSIALGSIMVQNFLKSTYENGFFNSQQLTNTSQGSAPKNSSSLLPEPMSFYSFCMLLFPQTPKSIPCSVFIIDTLFYLNTPESKDIIYVFKDKRRNFLIKMKNKNKSAYELFMKRRQNYEVAKMKQDKLRKAGYFDLVKKNKSSSKFTLLKTEASQPTVNYLEPPTSTTHLNEKRFEPSVKCLYEDSQSYCDQEQNPQFGSTNYERQKYSIIQEEEVTSSQEIIKEGRQSEGNGHFVKFQQDYKDGQGQVFGQNLRRRNNVISIQSVSKLSEHSSITQFKNKVTKLSFQSTYKTLITQESTTQPLHNRHPFPTTSPSLQQTPTITPSNSVRQSYHTLQTNYIALLKYNNSHIIRLKPSQFKAIFHNPLYANERFKNNNNTQYIQALPIEDQFKDLKVYSMHFHYQLFKDEELFLWVKNSLYKENQYMALNSAGNMGKIYQSSDQSDKNHNRTNNWNVTNSYKTPQFEAISPERKNSIKLKEKLRHQSIEVYLYYQIFQMYTYASMHYNKQILNGIFRFIEYQNDYALFETQNVVAKEMPKEAEFIRAKIFSEDCFLNEKDSNEISMEKVKIKDKNADNIGPSNNHPTNSSTTTQFSIDSTADTPTQTMKKINKQILKLKIGQNEQESSGLQKQLVTYFTSQNTKIENEMSNYFTDKIEKIKNVKDMHLSKNIFRIINNGKENSEESMKKETDINCGNLLDDSNSQQKLTKQQTENKNQFSEESQLCDFHQILNDHKKLQKFLKEKQANDPYARKNISNYSVVRWKQEVKKAKQRKSASINDHNNLGNSNIFEKENLFERSQLQKIIRKDGQVSRPMTANSCRKEVNSRITSKGTNNAILPSDKQNILMMMNSNLSSSPNRPQTPSNKSRIESSVSRFEKRLINEKYTQWNKSKFKLIAFRADKFI